MALPLDRAPSGREPPPLPPPLPQTARQHKAGAQGAGQILWQIPKQGVVGAEEGGEARSQGTRRRCPSWVQGRDWSQAGLSPASYGQLGISLGNRNGRFLVSHYQGPVLGEIESARYYSAQAPWHRLSRHGCPGCVEPCSGRWECKCQAFDGAPCDLLIGISLLAPRNQHLSACHAAAPRPAPLPGSSPFSRPA